MTLPEKYTLWMETVAADQAHGYSQASRWGTPDYDCSSLVISALEKVGIPAKSKGATYTGNMYPVLSKLGFVDVKDAVNLKTGAGLQRGDILLNVVKHTAVYCGNGKIVHARGQSYGSSKPGDQGSEIAVSNYYNSPWDYVLRYTGGGYAPGRVGNCTVTLGQYIVGSVDNQVKVIQTLLNWKGYKGKNGKVLDVDGELGENTAYAITSLQKAAGMSGINFGTVSHLTWAELLKG